VPVVRARRRRQGGALAGGGILTSIVPENGETAQPPPSSGGDEPRPAPPSAAVLRALDADRWAQVLVALRRVLSTRDGLDDAHRQLLDTATSRLVSGAGRDRAVAAIADDPGLWDQLRSDPLVAALALDVTPETTGTAAADPPEAAAAGHHLRTELERTKQRAKRVREDRDGWRRRAEGAEARSERLERRLSDAEHREAELRRELAAAQRRAAADVEERMRAVERERRRRDAEVARLREQVATLRRQLDEEGRSRAREQAQRARARAPRAEPRATEPEVGPGLVVGRPSRLPTDVAPGTTEAASLLLHRGRRVLVDGYNVTKQHRGHLDLETQRTWLVQLLGTAVATRGIRPAVVFDGERSGGGRPAAGRREVEVWFTPAGITADDELVLAVEATDEPVVVVTDDRELTDRLAASGADVLGTTAFLGAAGRAG
jgi:hypothetical protein